MFKKLFGSKNDESLKKDNLTLLGRVGSLEVANKSLKESNEELLNENKNLYVSLNKIRTEMANLQAKLQKTSKNKSAKK